MSRGTGVPPGFPGSFRYASASLVQVLALEYRCSTEDILTNLIANASVLGEVLIAAIADLPARGLESQEVRPTRQKTPMTKI